VSFIDGRISVIVRSGKHIARLRAIYRACAN